MGSLSAELSSALYSGGAVASSDVPHLLPVALNGRAYLIDPEKYERNTIPAIRQPVDQSREPSEQSLNTEGLWKRAQESWHFGAGQEWRDALDSDPQRFYTSKGIDVWDKFKLTLLKTTELKRASANTNLKVLLVGDHFYIADGQQVHWTTDPTVASPTFTSSVIHAGEAATTVNDITSDGARVFAALGANGVHQSTKGAATSTALSAYTAELIEYANGRLIAANNDELVEVNRDGTTTTLFNHTNDDFQWLAIEGSPSAIYAAGFVGEKSEVYGMQVAAATGALEAPVFAMDLPDGEVISQLAYYGGVMLIGSNKGLRVADIGAKQIGDDISLTYGPLIEIPNVRAFEPQGEYVWFNYDNYDGVSTGVGRVNLSRFTEPLVPAYATDLMATTQGSVLSIATFSDRRYFAVSAVGFYGETADFEPTGTINSGKIRHGTDEDKIAVTIDYRHDSLAGTVALELILDDGTEIPAAVGSTANSLGPGEPVTVLSRAYEWTQVALTLTRGSASTTPTFRRWTLRSLAMPYRTDEIILPIILKTSVNASDDDEGQHYPYDDLLEEFNAIKALERAGIVTYQEGQATYSVFVDRVGVRPEKWSDGRRFFNGLVICRLLTI